MKRASLPPEMVQFFSAYMNPADLHDAQLVETSDDNKPHTAPPRRAPLDIWVSYVPRLRCFSAHREGIGTMQASSLRELLAKIAEAMPEAEIKLHLSKVARNEASRRRGTPVAPVGWT
jgi:hypothetical protein